jgi:hypothetical protein
MIHEAPPPAPHLVAAAEASTPSPEPPPPAEATLPPPTVEQAQAADHVFTARPQRDPLATLVGVWASAVMLRDLAIDNFDTSGADEEPEEEPKKNEDADSAP